MNPLIQHEAILASAGSGKTFQLAHRYIRLLAHGVEPNRIIAITFSRKAAGEIFTAIVTHLRAAAVSEQQAAETAEQIQRPELKAADFLGILRRFLNDLQRLHISTIDSFTIGILRAFPMELGIAPGFDVMDQAGVQAEHARTDAFGQLFQSLTADHEARSHVLEAFKQATHQQESKRFAADFDRFIAEYQNQYKLLPEPDAWGRAQRIWPGGCAWLTPPPDFAGACAALREFVRSGDWTPFALNKWNGFLDALEAWHPGLPWHGDLNYMMCDRLLAQAHELKSGSIDLKFNRATYTIDGEPARRLWQTVKHVMHLSIQHALTTTEGLHRLLEQFERVYDAQVRRPGRITFDDAQYLITQGGRALTRQSDDPARLYIDYRLDCELDHWLIDEFQDTSDLQWEVFRNLADEVIQDNSGTRSFFFVGDVKQAIYGWRGGNYKLFGHILEQYGGAIEQRPMTMSYRSAQPVIDVINQSFSALPDEIPAPVQKTWQTFWKEHGCRQDRPPPPGHVAYIEAGEDRGDKEARWQACADLLCTMDPLRRGLTVAILVRKNDTAIALANALRAACPQIPIAVEGQSELADNPVVLLLLSLAQYAAHPGDTLAREHLRMSPLGPTLNERGATPPSLLDQIYQDGFQRFVQDWGETLHQAHPLDDFGRHRLTAFVDAAGEYDETGHRSIDEFIAHMRAYSFPEQAADSTVRIMTVHKSKGLGFDVVLVPDLSDGNSITTTRRDGIHIARNDEGLPHWALLMPNKPFCEQDETLHTEQQRKDDDGCFENLCALYVALTRAKRGLYLFASPPPANVGALNNAAYLRLQLTGDKAARGTSSISLGSTSYGLIYESGDRDWYTTCAPPDEGRVRKAKTLPTRFPKKKSLRRRLLRVAPSARAEAPRAAHLLFAPKVSRSLDLGTAVHALFEALDWSDTCDVGALTAQWRAQQDAPDEEAIAHFQRALETPAFQAALKKPDAPVTLWREKMFEAVIDNEWLTGTFDRVVIARDSDGRATRAVIMDFKTNDVEESTLSETVAHYRPQLRLYIQALSKLLQLSTSNISAELLFTRIGRVEEVTNAR